MSIKKYFLIVVYIFSFLCMYGCKDNIDIVKETKYLYDNNRTTNGIITDYQFAKSTE